MAIPTWLLVEDEPYIYEMLVAMFQLWGIDGVAFVNGSEAIAWIDDVDNGHFRGELPGLALIDIRLPGSISGPMVGERLRRSPYLKDIAIVLTTAYTMNDEETHSVMSLAGADKLIMKPLPKLSEFKKQLEAVVAQRRAQNNIGPGKPPIVKAPNTPTKTRQGRLPTNKASSRRIQKKSGDA